MLPGTSNMMFDQMEIPWPFQRLVVICPSREDSSLAFIQIPLDVILHKRQLWCWYWSCWCYPTDTWCCTSQKTWVENGRNPVINFSLLDAQRHISWISLWIVGTAYFSVQAVLACCRSLKGQRIRRWQRRDGITALLLPCIEQKLCLVSNLVIALGTF